MAASTKKVIFVLGPTASGKSSWALQQAQKLQGSIINIDSVQFYEGLEVGSAAPSAAEKKLVPHYLYSYVKAPQEMTAGKYVDEFYRLIENPNLKFPLFIVGGTGFYIQALEKGLYDIEPISPTIREKLEEELSAKGADVLYAELKAKDPASIVHVNDHYRLVRALEIIRSTGKTPSAMKSEQEFKRKTFPFDFMKLGFSFEKEVFLKRVKARTAQMLQRGLIEETDFFLKKGLSDWAPLSSVGYKETLQFLQQNETKDWLSENVSQSTMKLIKKQKTWFKRDSAVLWSAHETHLERFLTRD